ncbi:MAG: SIS domain-containing protein [Parasporobacterium sp.]|nr:SIS domain-containing protein [Parasporobacterium sp.]
MVKYNREEQIASVRGALALRSEIEKIVDSYCNEDFRNLCYLGIGGTWASCLQAVVHMKERTDRDVFAANAAEYNTTGDRRVGRGTVVVISSVTGTTVEIVAGVRKAQADGAKVIGFVDNADCELAGMVDNCITYKSNEQLKFFMTADRFMFNWGEMDEYEEFYGQMDKYLPEGLVEIEEKADSFGEEYAKAHLNDRLHYFVGAGTMYGATYSYAMCYWEEMHWIRTKSIHSAEFFHGMLEIIDDDTPVTLFVTEDSQRSLSERVARFLPKINHNHTVIDAADYPIEGIDAKFRGNISHLIIHAVTNRIDAHLEAIGGHDMTIRRYYRKFDY